MFDEETNRLNGCAKRLKELLQCPNDEGSQGEW